MHLLLGFVFFTAKNPLRGFILLPITNITHLCQYIIEKMSDPTYFICFSFVSASFLNKDVEHCLLALNAVMRKVVSPGGLTFCGRDMTYFRIAIYYDFLFIYIYILGIIGKQILLFYQWHMAIKDAIKTLDAANTFA